MTKTNANKLLYKEKLVADIAARTITSNLKLLTDLKFTNKMDNNNDSDSGSEESL